MALVLAGMNDVINSQGYTQAAFWNRLPVAVWWLMMAIALCSNVLFGFRSRDGKAARKLAFVLPFVIAIAFLLIAYVDAPRRGLIQVRPQNLEALVKSLTPHRPCRGAARGPDRDRADASVPTAHWRDEAVQQSLSGQPSWKCLEKTVRPRCWEAVQNRG
jgi:hypothetical protein